jgi:hypothetical protein
VTRPGAPAYLLVLLGGAVLGTALLVLVPEDDVPSSAVWRFTLLLRDAGVPEWLRSYALWEFLANIALFVPLGMLGALLRPSWPLWLWTTLALVASGSLELTQAAFLSGRTASSGDVLANALGLLCGVLAARAGRRLTGGYVPVTTSRSSR